jgi:cation/acetate symporter
VFPGALMIMGVDAFVLIYGWVLGFLFAAVLLAPFLRKVGAFTVPSFFFDRFSSRTLRIAVAALLMVPLIAILAAEARLAAAMARVFLDVQAGALLAVIIGVPTLIVALGGLRAMVWTSTAKAIVTIVAVLTVTTICALMLSLLPIQQITHGSLVRDFAKAEALQAATVPLASPLAAEWPGLSEELLSRRYLQPFTSIGWLGFPLAVIVLAAGFASMPHSLPRYGATLGVYDARKAQGWAVVIAALLLISLAAGVAIFRSQIAEQVVGQPAARAPLWFIELRDAGLLTVRPTAAPNLSMGQIGVYRDRTVLGLPLLAGLPLALVALMAVGAIAAAMAAIGAAIQTLATTVSEDILFGLGHLSTSDVARVRTARAATGAAGILAFVVAALPADPLQLVLIAATLSASSIFPVVVLAILWRRITAWGALLGLLVGFGLAVLGLLFSESGLLALAAPLPAVVALPSSVIATIVGSYMTRAGSRGDLELLRDMRVPGGETISDRVARQARAKALTR